jgi:phage shock protein A
MPKPCNTKGTPEGVNTSKEINHSTINGKQIMGIMKRVIKIFRADIHRVMDRLEDQGLLLKQYLRDMAEELYRKEAQLQQMMVSNKQAGRDYERYSQQCAALENDLKIAVQNGKDDIARMLIKKIKPMDNLRAGLGGHIKIMDTEIMRLKDILYQQRLRYEQLKHRSAEYRHEAQMQQREKNLADPIPEGYWELTEKEVELELLKCKEALCV